MTCHSASADQAAGTYLRAAPASEGWYFGRQSHAYDGGTAQATDVNTVLTTGTLNQVLRAAAGTTLLNFAVDVSSSELEVGLPELGAFGVSEWRVELTMGQSPTGAVPPTVTMTRNLGLDYEDVHVELPQVRMDIVDPSTGHTAAVVQLDFYSVNPGFFFNVPDGRLQTDLDLGEIRSRVMEHRFSAWPSDEAVGVLLRPLLDRELLPRLRAAFAQIAMPEYESLPRVVAPVLGATQVGDYYARRDTLAIFHVYDEE